MNRRKILSALCLSPLLLFKKPKTYDLSDKVCELKPIKVKLECQCKRITIYNDDMFQTGDLVYISDYGILVPYNKKNNTCVGKCIYANKEKAIIQML